MHKYLVISVHGIGGPLMTDMQAVEVKATTERQAVMFATGCPTITSIQELLAGRTWHVNAKVAGSVKDEDDAVVQVVRLDA